MPIDHPLVLEISSLKAALDKYQHAAHSSSLQLQRAHLEVTEVSARCKSVEAENSRLKHEIAFLRAHPDTTPTSIQVSELSLALRHVSDKLSLTESTLLQRTTELTHALSKNARIQLQVKAALTEVTKARQREEEGQSRLDELQRKTKAAEEEARMADVVVMEYAELVRSLEGKLPQAGPMLARAEDKPLQENGSSSNGVPQLPSPPFKGDHTNSYSQTKNDALVQSLTENRSSLQRLLYEFNLETSSLQDEINRIHTELSFVQSELDSERENSRLDRVKLAEALVEVDRCKTDDAAAGKMVARYMRFSQSSMESLQKALSTLKSRHTATLASLTSSSEALSRSLEIERRRAYQLRDVLDQLTEDISRETFGRRREIALRLRSVVREEKTASALSAWLRRAEEMRLKIRSGQGTDGAESSQAVISTTLEVTIVLDYILQDARSLLASLSLGDSLTSVDVIEKSSLERVALAEEIARSLTVELQNETQKRINLAKTMAEQLFTLSPSEPVEKDATAVNLEGQCTSSEFKQDLAPDQANVSKKGFDSIEPTNQQESTPQNSDPETSPTNQLTRSEERNEAATTQSVAVEQTPVASWESMQNIHPLLKELPGTSHRYDSLQRAFRDCHLTLAKLKADIAPISPTLQVDAPLIYNVIHRLDDFCEDVRVELEILITDEERMAKGFETLLGVPGALTGDEERERIERELKMFLDGTSPQAVRAKESYTTKLDDLQHDIAVVKQAIHESIDSVSEVLPENHSKTQAAWSSWTPFLSPSRSPSPAQTFGNIVTAPRPRRVSSNSLFLLSSRAPSDLTLASNDPYAYLGLRIPMPSQSISATPALQSSPSRLRKTTSSSGMYLLGLGSRSGFFSKPEIISEANAERNMQTGGLQQHAMEPDAQQDRSDVE